MEGGGGKEPQSGGLRMCKVKTVKWHQLKLISAPHNTKSMANLTAETTAMGAEEKRIIEELLAGCSPTVQRIVNAHNWFTIPPPSEKEENDDEVVSMALINHLHTNDINNV